MLGEASNSLSARVSVLWGHRDVSVLGSESFTGAVVLIVNGLVLSGQSVYPCLAHSQGKYVAGLCPTAGSDTHH